MRSKAHNSLTAPLVFTSYKDLQMRYEKVQFQLANVEWTFFIVIYHSSPVKGAMNAARACKLRNGVKKKRLYFFFFSMVPTWTKCVMNILRSYLNWWHNWQLKNRKRNRNRKNRIIRSWKINSRRDASFHKHLSNEPNLSSDDTYANHKLLQQ